VDSIRKIISKFFSLFARSKNDASAQNKIEFDKKLVYRLSKSRVPNFRQLKYIRKYLTSTEAKIIYICLFIIFISTSLLIGRFYYHNVKKIPAVGGEYREALIGPPKYLNPLYAEASDVDNDLTHLVYSSLFKRGKDGGMTNDMADSMEVSPDAKFYTIKLKSNLKWNNENNLTANDIIFTFNAIKNEEYNSKLKNKFKNVEIEKIDDLTIKFILSEPYAAFLELLNFGIMPEYLWSQIPPDTAYLADLNFKPVGSGPYKVASITKDNKTGVIRSYTLETNENYFGDKPKIKTLIFKFYKTFEEALAGLNSNEVEGISYLPKDFYESVDNKNLFIFNKLYLPQVSAVFFNFKSNLALQEKNVRQALSFGIDKDLIIKDVLNGDGFQIDSPILPNNFAYFDGIKKYNYNIGQASKLLDDAGWLLINITKEEVAEAEKNKEDKDEAKKKAALKILSLGEGKWRKKKNEYLNIKLTTVDKNENIKVVEAIKTFWEALGVKTNLEIVSAAQIEKDVIKPRNFESLFYGQVVGADPDLYAFWHSSQTIEGRLNISSFTNKDVDAVLEEARKVSDVNKRKELYKKFQEIITEEQPAIFIYSPIYTYLQSKKINGFNTTYIYYPFDRFSNISDWYIKTKRTFNL